MCVLQDKSTKVTRNSEFTKYLRFHVPVNHTIQVTAGRNIEHLSDNFCRIFLTVSTVLPVVKKDHEQTRPLLDSLDLGHLVI